MYLNYTVENRCVKCSLWFWERSDSAKWIWQVAQAVCNATWSNLWKYSSACERLNLAAHIKSCDANQKVRGQGQTQREKRNYSRKGSYRGENRGVFHKTSHSHWWVTHAKHISCTHWKKCKWPAVAGTKKKICGQGMHWCGYKLSLPIGKYSERKVFWDTARSLLENGWLMVNLFDESSEWEWQCWLLLTVAQWVWHLWWAEVSKVWVLQSLLGWYSLHRVALQQILQIRGVETRVQSTVWVMKRFST